MNSEDHFAAIEGAFERGAGEGFALLANTLRSRKEYPRLFEARVMEARHKLGLPLIQVEDSGSLPPEQQQAVDRAYIDAAREVGGLFLAEGDIPRAWQYFRAIGDPAPVAAAIENAEPGENIDAIIEIAFQEAVHPRKGFELILSQYGICRAITCFSQYPARQGRQDCIRLLVRTLHGELVAALSRAIEQAEGRAPETRSVPALIAGRDWLFGEYSYYVDTSHLVSVLQISIELQERETLSLALELAEYGRHLSANFQSRGEPPFEDLYTDTCIYLRGVLEHEPEGAVAHFRRKVAESEGPAPAQVLVELLYRLRRYADAIQISLEHLREIPPSQLACPSLFQLCQAAGDYDRLRSLARDRADPVHYAAAVIQARVRRPQEGTRPL